MNNIVKFGEDVEGYAIPVLNEREIRAAAGILFLMMFISIQTASSGGGFTMLKYAVVIFLTDIIIRVFLNPKFSPTLIIGRLIVRNQTPEFVGAQQKKFAWMIGLVLAVIMVIHLVVLNASGPVTGLICMICLIFLFCETAFGICIGCKVYSLLYRKKAQYCPGEVCDVRSRKDIQKISWVQLLIVIGFIVYIVATVALFKDNFARPPYDLFGSKNSVHSR